MDVEIEMGSGYFKVTSDSGESRVHAAGQWEKVAQWLEENPDDVRITKDGGKTLLKLRTSMKQFQVLQLALNSEPTIKKQVEYNMEKFVDSLLPLDGMILSRYKTLCLSKENGDHDNELRISHCRMPNGTNFTNKNYQFLPMTMMIALISFSTMASVLRGGTDRHRDNNFSRWVLLLTSLLFISSISSAMFLIRDVPSTPQPQICLLMLFGSYICFIMMMSTFITEALVLLFLGGFFLLFAAGCCSNQKISCTAEETNADNASASGIV